MVEGHSCHRLAFQHRKRLVGRRFQASSPNGRFSDGAAAIEGKVLLRIEVHGKNLFYFFEGGAIIHIHFGMSGHFSVHKADKAPEATEKTRLRLVEPEADLVAQLSAMVVRLCDHAGYEKRAAALGPDPLREDADPERLWARWKATPRSVGALLMDQTAVAGIGNIFRAEILFKAGVHPEQPALSAGREIFERVWSHSVGCLQAGFRLGSIRTVDPEEAKRLGPPWQRRYIYNQATCGRCGSSVVSWVMATRRVYSCPGCQPLLPGTSLPQKRLQEIEKAQGVRLFPSACAPDPPSAAALQPAKLTVVQLRELLVARGLDARGGRRLLMARLLQGAVGAAPKPVSASSWGRRLRRRIGAPDAQPPADAASAGVTAEELLEEGPSVAAASRPVPGAEHLLEEASTAAAAAEEKLAAGEGRSVEHVAEMDDAVLQLLRLRQPRRKKRGEQDVRPVNKAVSRKASSSSARSRRGSRGEGFGPLPPASPQAAGIAQVAKLTSFSRPLRPGAASSAGVEGGANTVRLQQQLNSVVLGLELPASDIRQAAPGRSMPGAAFKGRLAVLASASLDLSL